MKSIFWSHGHIAWPLFASLLFSMLLFLSGDFVWRLTNTRFWRLSFYCLCAWLIGIVLIFTLLR